jgi:hypothetical protein
VRWAADATPSSSVWPILLPALLTLVGVVITVGGALWVKRLSRRLENAQANKTDSESRKAEAEAESTQVTTARGLVAEIRSMMVDQRETYEGQIRMLQERGNAQIETVQVQHSADMKAMTDRLCGIEASFRRHRDWDVHATALLRQSDPSFPDPPPVHFD